MFSAYLSMLIFAVFAAVLGFLSIAADAVFLARVSFVAFLVLFQLGLAIALRMRDGHGARRRQESGTSDPAGLGDHTH